MGRDPCISNLDFVPVPLVKVKCNTKAIAKTIANNSNVYLVSIYEASTSRRHL